MDLSKEVTKKIVHSQVKTLMLTHCLATQYLIHMLRVYTEGLRLKSVFLENSDKIKAAYA